MTPERIMLVAALMSAANVGFTAATFFAYRRFVRLAFREQGKVLDLLVRWIGGDPAAEKLTLDYFGVKRP